MLGLIVGQGHIHGDLSEQAADLAGPVIENVQGVVPDDRHAQHAHGQQILGRELIRHLRPVTATAEPLKVSARVLRPASCGIVGKIILHKPDRDILIAKLHWNVDTHRTLPIATAGAEDHVPGKH